MFKKLKLLYLYISILKKNREKFKLEHNISIDWVWRMYKTYTIPEEEIDNIKTLGVKYLNDLLKKEISTIDKTFMPLGLSELVGLMEAVELNDRQIGLAFRFKHINTANFFGRLIWLAFYVFFGLIGFLIGNIFGIFIGLFTLFIIYLISRIFI
jgi:hypothetical protein